MGFRASVVIQFASKYASVIVNLAITMVLARILTPTQYGTMSVVSVFVGLFSILSNVGINAAVIQYRDLTDEDLEALFTFTWLIGVAMALVFCAISVPISAFYGDSQYVPLMCVASLSVLFHSANMVPNGVLVRDKKFMAIGLRTILTSLVCGIVCVILALRGWGTYALVLNGVLSAALVLIWNLAASRLPLAPRDFRPQLALVGRFSGFQFASQVTQYLIRSLDNLLVGAFMGPTALGLYDKAYKLCKYPINIVPSTLSPVLKSFFSAIQDDRERLYSQYIRVQKVLSIVGAFGSVVFFFCATELILLAFGNQWTESIEPFRALSVSLAFQMVNFTVFSALEALKRTDLLMRSTMGSGAVMVALMLAGVMTRDLVIVAWCVTAGFIVYTVFVVHYVIRRGFKKPVLPYLKLYVPELTSALIASVALAITAPMMPENIVASLALKLLIAGVAYGVPMLAMGQQRYLLDVLGRRRGGQK